jgi:uncharacterized protein (TIGR00369 family)
VNTDRALVLEFLAGARKPLPITSNPLASALGGELLELDADAGTAVLAFRPPQSFSQGAGVLQGGIVATLLDFAMAFAVHAVLATRARAFATANLSVSLLRPAHPGRYLARGRVVRAGRTLLFAEATLVAQDGGIVATATAVMPLADGD